MKNIIILVLLFPFSLLGQYSGNFQYNDHKGQVISNILKHQESINIILNNFFADFNTIENSEVCVLDKNSDLINCVKLTDSTYYWNAALTYDSLNYILTGLKSSNIENLDSVLIELRDLNFKLLKRFTYYSSPIFSALPLTNLDSTYKIFEIPDLLDSDSFLEFTIPPGLDFNNIKIKSIPLNDNFIVFFKSLKIVDTYLAWYLGGIAKTDSTFSNPKYLNDKILYNKGSIIDAIDSGYIAFGNAKNKNDGSELGIVKYDSSFSLVKYDIIGEGPNSYEIPAISNTISKNALNYYITGFIGADKGDISLDTAANFLYIGKYDIDINRIWLKKVGGDRHYYVWGVDANDEGGCCIYGMCRSKETDYVTTPFIMCVDDNGEITSTKDPNPQFLDFTLLGNPGSNELQFRLGPGFDHIRYDISNLNGQVISKGIGSEGISSISSVSWPPGVYILSFTNKGQILHSEKWIKSQP